MLKNVNYFLFIVSKENWKIIKSKNIIGTDNQKTFNKIMPNDKILVYINGISKINALYNVEEKFEEYDQLFIDKDYRFRFKINEIEFFDETIDFKELVHKLKFIKNKDKWFTHIGGSKGATQISLRDYTALIKALV
ncbi:MAG: EVE domain-containing protein [Candidatus Lokiarchaeota archaeon]|nr:EVE domain-containing protein [Candidatus Lokiarchaeota archaeon]